MSRPRAPAPPATLRAGQAVEVSRARIAAVRGAQVHSGDEACSKCHRLPADKDVGGGRAEVDAAITGTVKAGPNPHAVASRDPKQKPFFQDQVACVDCHFGNMEKPLTQTLGQFRDQGAAWATERTRKASKLAQEDRWRAEFGRQLEGYPGLGTR